MTLNVIAKYNADTKNVSDNGLPVIFAGKAAITSGLTEHNRKVAEHIQTELSTQDLTEVERAEAFIKEYDKHKQGLTHAAVSKKVNSISAYGFAHKVKTEDIPEAKRKQVLDYQQAVHMHDGIPRAYERHTNCWEVPEYTATYLDGIEQRAKQLKDNLCTKKALKKEYFIRTEGVEAAEDLYPQEEATISAKNDILVNFLETYIKQILDNDGYILESSIYNDFTDGLTIGFNRYSRDKIETQYKVARNQLITKHGWTRTNDKDTRYKLGLPPVRGNQPYIITK